MPPVHDPIRMISTMEAGERERGRWARLLHDETLQSLAALQMFLGTASHSGDTAVLRAAISQASDQISQEIEGLRALISELRPAVLDQLGLAPAIESLAARTQAVTGLELGLALELPATRLDSQLETAVYRIVQEALENVGRHAQAERVDIRVDASGDRLRVEVADDGRGFLDGLPAEGFGLASMRERVELAGGELELSSSPAGTRVRACLPLPGPARG